MSTEEVKLTGLPAASLVLTQNASNTDIILPKYVYIKDKDGRYLVQRSGPKYATLTFQSGEPDPDSTFKAVIVAGSLYRLYANKDRPVMRYYAGWYSSDYPETSSWFQVIHASGNKVYLKDNYMNSLYFSSDLNDYGAPNAHSYLTQSSLMEIEPASMKNEIMNIKYDIPGGKVREAQPMIALSTNVQNDSDATVSQMLTYSYQKWSVGTWNDTAGIELGGKVSFEAGVPVVATAKFEISVTASYSHTWGGETGKQEIVSSSTTVTVPPRKKASAQIIIRNAHIDVGFTYTRQILWADGTSTTEYKHGIYSNVDSWHVDVVLDDWEDI